MKSNLFVFTNCRKTREKMLNRKHINRHSLKLMTEEDTHPLFYVTITMLRYLMPPNAMNLLHAIKHYFEMFQPREEAMFRIFWGQNPYSASASNGIPNYLTVSTCFTTFTPDYIKLPLDIPPYYDIDCVVTPDFVSKLVRFSLIAIIYKLKISWSHCRYELRSWAGDRQTGFMAASKMARWQSMGCWTRSKQRANFQA